MQIGDVPLHDMSMSIYIIQTVHLEMWKLYIMGQVHQHHYLWEMIHCIECFKMRLPGWTVHKGNQNITNEDCHTLGQVIMKL